MLNPSPPPPSPPESPALSASGSSVSSLPSVSSSFFFSSAPASPPHPASHAHSVAGDELIIPSLTLPPPLPIPRHPREKQRERTAPIVRLLVLGPRDAAVSAILSATSRHGYEHEYDPGCWFEDDGYAVLRIPSLRDKGTHEADIELIVVRDDLQLDGVIHIIERHILGPFRRLADVLMPPSLSSDSDADRELIECLLTSGTTPLFTALVVVGEEAELSASIPDSMRALIPVVALPRPPPTHDDAETDSAKAADEAHPDPPPTAPLRPRNANREMTETGRITLTDDAPSSSAPESDAYESPILDIPALRLSSARLFLRWWHAGARGAYSQDEFRLLPLSFSSREKTFFIPPHVYLTPPPAPSDPAHVNPYTYAHLSSDPLHLPSLVLLFRGVVSATARQVQQATAWWGGAFLIGVLVGVGFGVGMGVGVRRV